MSENGINKRNLSKSFILSLLSFALNIAIGFFTSPFIVEKLGAVAHGFSTLGTNFTNYMSLMTIAINSFASRYITIALKNNDKEQASKYFTSVFYANVILAVISLLPISVFLLFFERIIVVPSELVSDVQIQWVLLFLSWILELLFKVFSTATYAKNRLDINHGLGIASSILRLACIIVFFGCFTPRLWYIGVASIICRVLYDGGYLISQRRIMPEVKLHRKYFDFKSLRTLIVKGIWNSINQLAAILISGLGLLVTNLFVNPISMGYYAIAQILPTYLQSLMYTICELFSPSLIMSYAEKRNDKVREGLIFAMNFNGIILMVPLLGFLVYGYDFYRLWQGSLDSDAVKTVFVLSSLVLLPMVSSIFVQPLLSVNTVTARLKIPAFVNILIGLISIVIQIILIKTTDLGVYAVAGVSSVLLLIRNYVFYPIYSAQNLNLPATTFYPTIIKGTIVTAAIFMFLYITNSLIQINNWGQLMLYAIIFGLAAEVLVFLLLLTSKEKKQVISKLLRKNK